jgi:hypothetical protein
MSSLNRLLNWLATWLARLPWANWFAHWVARIYAGKYSTQSINFELPYHWTRDRREKAIDYFDCIMKATHGATRGRLANGSAATAQYITEIDPNTKFKSYTEPSFYRTKVFFSTYSGNPEGAQEEAQTMAVLQSGTHIGAIPTTTAEAMGLRKYYDELSCGDPQTMLIVTDEFNSRRTKDIYQKFFPGTKIFVAALPIDATFDPESPISNFRDLKKAIWMETIFPSPIFWILLRGGEWGKKKLIGMSDTVCQDAATPPN